MKLNRVKRKRTNQLLQDLWIWLPAVYLLISFFLAPAHVLLSLSFFSPTRLHSCHPVELNPSRLCKSGSSCYHHTIILLSLLFLWLLLYLLLFFALLSCSFCWIPSTVKYIPNTALVTEDKSQRTKSNIMKCDYQNLPPGAELWHHRWTRAGDQDGTEREWSSRSWTDQKT